MKQIEISPELYDEFMKVLESRDIEILTQTIGMERPPFNITEPVWFVSYPKEKA